MYISCKMKEDVRITMTDMYEFETMDIKGESVHLVAVCDKHPHIRFQSAIGHIIGIINFSYS